MHPTVESSSARSVNHTKSSSGVCTPLWSQVLHAVCIIPSQAPQYPSHRGVKFCTQCASYRVKLRGMHHTVESNCTPRIQSFLNFMIKYLSKIKTEFENFWKIKSLQNYCSLFFGGPMACLNRAGNSLICSSLRSFDHSLILLKSIERLWAIRSDCSRQMSDCEWIAQVAQDKWAIVSESLKSLMKNEQLWAIRSGGSWLMSKWVIRSNIFG